MQEAKTDQAIDLSRWTVGLRLGEDGVWRAPETAPVSYPEDQHSACMQIEDGSFWFNHRNACIQAAILRFAPPELLLFDIGGGNGFVSRQLSLNGIETVLVEPGEEGVRNAGERGVRNRVCSTLGGAGFRDGVLPSVGLFDVIEHIEDDAGFIRDTMRYLVDDGMMYITVPAYQGLWSVEDEAAGHHRRYNLGSIGDMLTRAGMTVDYATYFFSFLPVPLWLFRALPARLGLRKQRIHDRNAREHQAGSPITRRVLDVLMASELRRIEKGQSIALGASCLVVARKGRVRS